MTHMKAEDGRAGKAAGGDERQHTAGNEMQHGFVFLRFQEGRREEAHQLVENVALWPTQAGADVWPLSR